MFCAQCGAQLRPNAQFCATCGASVQAGTAPGVAAAPGFVYADTRTEYAGFWIRVVAAIIDGIILGIVNSFVGVITGQGAGGTTGFATLLSLAIGAAYYIVAYSRYGQTVGKLAMGIKVVDANGGLLSPSSAAIRYIGLWVSAIILMVGYLMVAWDARKQGLHDKMAGSFVIKVRS